MKNKRSVSFLFFVIICNCLLQVKVFAAGYSGTTSSSGGSETGGIEYNGGASHGCNWHIEHNTVRGHGILSAEGFYEGGSGWTKINGGYTDIPKNENGGVRYVKLRFNFRFEGSRQYYEDGEKNHETLDDEETRDWLDDSDSRDFEISYTTTKNGQVVSTSRNPEFDLRYNNGSNLKNGEGTPAYQYRVRWSPNFIDGVDAWLMCPGQGDASGEHHNVYANGSGDKYINVGIFKDAEAIFGIRSTVNIEAGGKKYSTSAMNGSSAYGIDYYSPVVDRETGLSSQSFITEPASKSTEMIYFPSNNNDKVKMTFSHDVYRGLNTTYDSYIDYSKTIATEWELQRNYSNTQNGVVRTTTPADNVSDNHRTEFSQLDKQTAKTNEITIGGNDIGYGTFNKSYCEKFIHPFLTTIMGGINEYNTQNVRYDEYGANATYTQTCAPVSRPWNFALNLSTSLPGDEGDNILIANGQSKSGTVNIGNNRYEGSPEGSYQTETPNFDFRIYTFALGEDAAVESIPGSLFTQGGVTATGDIEGYLTSAISDLSGGNITQPLALQNNGGINKLSYGGDNRNVGVSFSVSEDTDPGTKFCIVAAVNYVNSGYSTSNNGSLYGVGYGDLTGQSTWLISNISCRSTASKSSFQVLGGDIVSRGAIDVSATRVHGQSFGSWVDYGLTSAGEITFGPFLGLASGAFGTFGRSEGFIYDSCKISDMTISNSHCGPTDDKNTYIGRSGIYQDFITTNNAAQYFSTTNPPSASRIMLKYITKKPNDPDPVSGTYRKLSDYGWGESVVNGTQVIHVSDAGLVIDQNLYYDSETIYESPSQIPQRIIIVDNGNVVIPHSVTNIDAWIIVKNGNLITCIDDLDKVDVIDGAYQIPAKEIRDSDVCNNQLKINGYVSSNYLELTRTYYKKSSEVSDSLRELYDNYGERITLPYSALVWSYTNYIIESTTNLTTTGTTSNKNFIRDAFTQSLPPRY